jgi:uncharacterized membrane protein YgcG
MLPNLILKAKHYFSCNGLIVFSLLLICIFLGGQVSVLTQSTSNTVNDTTRYTTNYTNNFTSKIDIQATLLEAKNLTIKYTIVHNFIQSSQTRRGIFFSLPKTQGGSRLEYKLESPPSKNGKSEPYEIFNETDEFRFRIGKSDFQNPAGEYTYQFTLSTEIDPNYSLDFIFLRAWQDQLLNSPKLTLISKGSNNSNNTSVNLCLQNKSVCDSGQVSSIINADKPAINPIVALFNQFWSYILALFSAIIIGFGVWQSNLQKSSLKQLNPKQVAFEEPKDILPWQAYYLTTDGKVNFKNTLLSYILYLNHKKIIEIIPSSNNLDDKNNNKKQQSKNIKINILQELPTNLLPGFMNTLVIDIASYGLSIGLKKSLIDPNQKKPELRQFIKEQVKSNYERLPIVYSWAIAIISGIGLAISWFVITKILQGNNVLIGNSWVNLGFFVIILAAILLWTVLHHWSLFTFDGKNKAQECLSWVYYLEYVEQQKLDFSNNPQDGIQYYLINVPWAAQFNFLNKFNKYFKSLSYFQDQSAISNTDVFQYALLNSVMYSAPSGSFDGGSFGGGGDGGFSGGGGSW